MATESLPNKEGHAKALGREEGPRIQHTEPKSPDIVDFDGLQDPQNPLNWSSARKITSIAIISCLTFVLPLISTIIAPGTEDVLRDFNSTDKTLGSFVTTAYVLGGVAGPTVIAPCSELYGRSITYQVSSLLFFIFNVACAVANNLGALVIFRLFAAVVGSCSITIGAGSIADMVPQEKRAAAMAGWAMGPILAPSIGPIIGAYLTPAKGWRWVFWVSTLLTGVCAILSLALKESYPYTILQRKTAKLRKETGNQNLRSKLDTGKTPRELFAFSIFRPLKMLFGSPVLFLIPVYVALIYAYIYLCFTTFPRVFMDAYGFSLGQAGLAYLGIGVGSLIGLLLCGATMDRISKFLTTRNGGDFRPEYRLPPMAVGVLVVPAGLFWYGWTAEHRNHWILPIIGTAFLGAGMNITFMVSQTYLVDAYTVYAASAAAGTTILRSLIGALLPLAGNNLYDSLGIGWGTSLLGFIALTFIPGPYLLYVYGEKFREYRLFRVKF
ncbi:MFS general substrate transporter [Byssothecium circinans]|uniref:MFS general substrate transporter n=1 Tax=Byssothecium circinans TaxID=147558 RepID=A0A6A5T8V6_9PLEO|nr:MFS general substrate transporter [Byssothecium circinans]